MENVKIVNEIENSDGDKIIVGTKQYYVAVREGLMGGVIESKTLIPVDHDAKSGKLVLPKNIDGLRFVYTTKILILDKENKMIKTVEREAYKGPVTWIGELVKNNKDEFFVFNKTNNRKHKLCPNEKVLAESKVEYLENIAEKRELLQKGR